MSNAASSNTSSDNPFLPLLKRAYYEGMMDRWINAAPHTSVILQACATDIATCQQNHDHSLSELFFISDHKKRYRMTHEDTNKIVSSTFQCMKKKEKTLHAKCNFALAYATRLDLAHPLIHELPHDISKAEQQKLVSKALQSFGKVVPQITTTFHVCRDSLHEKTCKNEAYLMASLVKHGNFQEEHIRTFLKCLRFELQAADPQCIQAIDHLDHLIRPDPVAITTAAHAGQGPQNAAPQTKPRDPHDGIGFVIFMLIAILYAYLYAYHKRKVKVDRRIIHPRPQQLASRSRPQNSSTQKKERSFRLEEEDDNEEEQHNNLDNATESSSLLLFDEFTSTATTSSSTTSAGTGNNSNNFQQQQQASSSNNNKQQPVYGVWETLS